MRVSDNIDPYASFAYPEGERPRRVLSVFLFIAKLLILILILIGARFVRLILVPVLIFLILPLDFLYRRHFQKRRWPSTCVLLAVILVLSYPLYKQAEPLRFRMLSGVYDSAAEQIMAESVPSADTSWRKESVPLPYALIVGNKAVVMKSDEHLALYFPSSIRIFSSTGMMWLSDEAVQSWLENPSVFDPGLAAGQPYDWLVPLNEDWCFVKLYLD